MSSSGGDWLKPAEPRWQAGLLSRAGIAILTGALVMLILSAWAPSLVRQGRTTAFATPPVDPLLVFLWGGLAAVGVYLGAPFLQANNKDGRGSSAGSANLNGSLSLAGNIANIGNAAAAGGDRPSVA